MWSQKERKGLEDIWAWQESKENTLKGQFEQQNKQLSISYNPLNKMGIHESMLI